MRDTVFIEGLEVRAILGIDPEERTTPQPVCIDIDMACDASAAAATEDIGEAVNYRIVVEAVEALTIEGRFQLAETLAERIATLVMRDFGVSWVRVRVRKPEALSSCRAVGVSVERGVRGG